MLAFIKCKFYICKLETLLSQAKLSYYIVGEKACTFSEAKDKLRHWLSSDCMYSNFFKMLGFFIFKKNKCTVANVSFKSTQ